MSFELLSEPIRKYIRDQRWASLRPIQNAAIKRILTTEDNYILASRTASGKTEAAFLPILSKVSFDQPGVRVLYISPLIALINDQFFRIEDLCKSLEIPVTKWHGEAKRSQKDRLLKHPEGIVLITPESIEAMFVNRPFDVRHLFSNLEFVVIDEIHAFIGTDRGVQLKSLLSRLQSLGETKFRIIGLSATIGDYDEAKKFTGNEAGTKVLVDKTAKPTDARFRYFPAAASNLPTALMNDLFAETSDKKALIFPNTRGRVEEVAVGLRKIAERGGGHLNYFAHHSSVSRDVREYVEFFAKRSRYENFCIACTSTLELGIDIGSVDTVVQIDSAHSVSSLIQRVGRSGRHDDKSSNLLLYATTKWDLVQALACRELQKEGFIEPPDVSQKPYDILLHQILSITKERSGIRVGELVAEVRNNFAFNQITEAEIAEITEHLIKNDLLERLGHEVIVGISGEKLVNSRDFYSMFTSEIDLKVVHHGATIGQIEYSPQIKENENLFLAARIWKIAAVDLEAKRIDVVPAKDGKKPTFSGTGAPVHPRIRKKMLEILTSDEVYEELDSECAIQLEQMRKHFSIFNIADPARERPLLIKENKCELFTFTGTRIDRTLQLLLSANGINFTFDNSAKSIELAASGEAISAIWKSLPVAFARIDAIVGRLIQSNPTIIAFSKWGSHLPLRLQAKLLKEKHFDVPGTIRFIAETELVLSSI